jgi:2-furoyl-CoA dehydrogenase 2Fe-2S iron sulfur subunit
MRRVNKDQKVRINLTLNGRKMGAETEPRTLLSDFLRHSLGATGTHVGCEHGVCGCCTVQIDGAAVRSCLTLAMQAEGLPEPSCPAMRFLHARHSHVVQRFPRAHSETNRTGVARGAERTHLPLYGIRRHHGGAEGSCRNQLNWRRQ